MFFLAAISIVLGIVTALVLRWTTRAGALRGARKRIQAHLLEFRLFFDEPSLIWRAQIELLRDNARLLRLLLPSALLLSVPTIWLLFQLEAFYGHRPLRAGEATIVTMQLKHQIERTDRVDLRGEGGVMVETPPLRIFRDNQIIWRIRAAGDTASAVDLSFNGRVIRKSVVAGNSAQLSWHPAEERLPAGDISRVEIEYPSTGSAWMVWFVALTLASTWSSLRWWRLDL